MTPAAPASGVQMLHFPPGAGVPNNPALPAVIMPGALDAGAGALAIRLEMEANGWGGTWTYTVFDYHHYHPNAHEALVCARGHGRIRLGGPDGQDIEVAPGDALILPAGTGHCRIEASAGFAVCGAYPPGQENYATMRAGELDLTEAARRIDTVPLPRTDPVHGPGGPLMAAWGIA